MPPPPPCLVGHCWPEAECSKEHDLTSGAHIYHEEAHVKMPSPCSYRLHLTELLQKTKFFWKFVESGHLYENSAHFIIKPNILQSQWLLQVPEENYQGSVAACFSSVVHYG